MVVELVTSTCQPKKQSKLFGLIAGHFYNILSLDFGAPFGAQAVGGRMLRGVPERDNML